MATTDLHKALSEISAIRGHIARGAVFRGYGPITLATTGVLALAAAMVQAYWLPAPQRAVLAYLAIWVSTAVLSLLIISVETITRARRLHCGLAAQMMQAAAEQFLPAIVAGLLLTLVLLRYAPQGLWMLPGLWQVVFSLGVFASCRFLPRAMFAAGIWYLCCGLMCLSVGAGQSALGPWMMGVPFGVGQLIVAGVLKFNHWDGDERA
jgi:hypothetical protein